MQGFKNFQIDGEEYQFGMLQPSKANRLFTKIVKSFLQPLGALLTGLKSKSLTSILDADVNFESAFAALSGNVTEDDFEGMVMQLLSTVRLGTGMEFNIDLQFTGRLLHMYKVAYKSFEVNYADFLDAKSGVAAFLRRAMTPASQTQTGSSGGPSSPELPRSMRSKAGGI
jgi:hypothetical protein